MARSEQRGTFFFIYKLQFEKVPCFQKAGTKQQIKTMVLHSDLILSSSTTSDDNLKVHLHEAYGGP